MPNELKTKGNVGGITEYDTYTSAGFDEKDNAFKFVEHLKERGIESIRCSKKTELLIWRKYA